MGIYIGQNKYTGGPADPSSSMIPKSIGTTAGDMIYFSGASTPVRLQKGSNGQVLTLSNGLPTWQTPSGGGTTVTLPSGYSASTGITLSSSALTTIATVGGTELKLKAPAGGGGSSNQDFYYTTATYDANFQHQGYSVYHVTTDPTKRNFVVVNLTSAQYPQDEVPQIIFNYNSNTQQPDSSLLPGAEIYMLIVNGTGGEIPQQSSVIDQEALFDTGVSGFWVNDPPAQLSNQSPIGFWKKIPSGASLFCSTIIKDIYGNPEFCVNTWLGTFYEI